MKIYYVRFRFNIQASRIKKNPNIFSQGFYLAIFPKFKTVGTQLNRNYQKLFCLQGYRRSFLNRI